MSTIHATAILLGERALLITGKSGAGKSSLALSLIREAQDEPSICVRLIADDRTHLDVAGSMLIARAPQTIEGMIEERGRGIIGMPFEPNGVVAFALELQETPQRLPDTEPTDFAGVKIPRFFHQSGTDLSLNNAMELMKKADNRRRL